MYSVDKLKYFTSLKSLSESNIQDIEKFLSEMNTHVENSIKEAISHESSYSALAELMVEHPRGAIKHVKLKKWAINVINQLKEIDSTITKSITAIDSLKKNKEDYKAHTCLGDALKALLIEIEKYGAFSTSFSNALAKEEEPLDHADHLKVKSEIVNALLNKKHLSNVYVDNIVSWC
jgi:type I site-specific restriction endonuclease